MKRWKILVSAVAVIFIEIAVMSAVGCGGGYRSAGVSDVFGVASAKGGYMLMGETAPMVGDPFDRPENIALSPRIVSDIDWSGTRELAAGAFDSALKAVLGRPPATDDDFYLQLFKIGAINAARGNSDSAIVTFYAVKMVSPLLAPLAMELIGDIHLSRNEYDKAIDAYSDALTADDLTDRYRRHLFFKIKSVAEMGGDILSHVRDFWYGEYVAWNDSILAPPPPVAAAPTRTRAQDRAWMTAWNLEVDRKYTEAIAAYRRVFNTEGNRVHEAHIRVALCHYKLRNYDSTIANLSRFLRDFPQSNMRMSAMFWQGKAHAARGRTEEAHKIWNTIAQLDPADYHAHRGRQIMGVPHQIVTPEALLMNDVAAREWLDAVSPEADKKELDAQDTINLRRAEALLAIAKPQLANILLDNYERNYFGNLLLQAEMASAYALAGSAAMSFSVGMRLGWRIPMEHRKDRPLQVMSIIYPAFYADTIVRYAERFNVDPLFVTSVMRQESIFNYRLVSSAGAIGLMQIMPATGRDIIAAELGEEFDTDSLYNPELNIRFGAFYLAKRLEQFNGNHVLALAAYNAGAHNAARWNRDRRRYADNDIFNEDIAFRETRIYVKRVMGNYWTYQMLVNTPGFEYHPSVRPEGN